MKHLAVFAIVGKFLLFSMINPVTAGVSGETEIRFQSDNDRYGETETTLEQWTSIYYKDHGGDLRMAIQFAVEAGEQQTSEQLYQCFLRSGGGIQQPELTIGRFTLADNSGFNTLDGFSIQQQLVPMAWKIYSGKPRHLDGYQDDTAELLLGFNTRYDVTEFATDDSFNKLTFNLGLEKVWSNTAGMILHAGLSGERPGSDGAASLRDFQLAVDLNLEERSLRRAIVDTHFDFKQQGQARVGYHYFQPDEDLDTFRDRYHGIYNDERQSIAKGVWYLPSTGALETRFEVSGNRHEQGNGGLGMAVEFIYTTSYGSYLEVRSDYLETDDDWVISNYLRHRQPLSSLSLLQTEAVYQTKETGLSGRNHLVGLSLSLTRRLLKQLFLNLDGEWLDHSDREDEYRLAMSLRYDFYQTDTGELP
jgi:hypothetical protein